MRCLLPLAVYCVSLLTHQQLLAAPVAELRDSSDLLQKQSGPADMEAPVPEVQSEVPAPEPSPAARRSSDALAETLKRVASANARVAASGLAWARPGSPGLRVHRRSLRTRRSAHHHRTQHRAHHHNSHHSKTNKDGCPLGTCSVHNLSHRLYQLIGQSGREGSSPINPRSPHSFG